MTRRWLPIWTLPLLVLFAIGTVALRLSIIRTTYEINQVERIKQNTQQELEKQRLRVAQLRSPRRLEILAREKFKLVPPTTDKIVYLK